MIGTFDCWPFHCFTKARSKHITDDFRFSCDSFVGSLTHSFVRSLSFSSLVRCMLTWSILGSLFVCFKMFDCFLPVSLSISVSIWLSICSKCLSLSLLYMELMVSFSNLYLSLFRDWSLLRVSLSSCLDLDETSLSLSLSESNIEFITKKRRLTFHFLFEDNSRVWIHLICLCLSFGMNFRDSRKLEPIGNLFVSWKFV